MNPLVTVVIRASYNQADIIGRTIESVLLQKTDFNFEILLGEDASPSDNTREVCERYESQNPGRVRIMPKGPNKGFLRNHLECIQACLGEFIAVCDGDDYWCDEHKLQQQVDFLRLHPDYVLVHAEMRHLNGATGVVSDPVIRSQVPQGDVRREVFTQHIANTSTVLYRRSALADADLNAWLAAGFGVDDIALWGYIAQQGKFHFEPICRAVYFAGTESSCHSNHMERRVKHMTNTYHILFYMWDLFRPNFDHRAIEQLYHYDLARMVLSNKEFDWVWQTIPKTGICMMLHVLRSSYRAKLCKQLIG